MYMKHFHLPVFFIWTVTMLSATAAHANELLVNGNGTLTSDNSPFNYYTTNQQDYETQTCYLAEQLADMSDGDTIHALTFYPINRKCDTIEAVYTVRLLETDLINSDFSFADTANSTLVYEGQLPYCNGEMRVEFTTPYIYHGSNLVIDFYVKEPSSEGIPNSHFYGSGLESGYYVQAIDYHGGRLMSNRQAKVLIEYTFAANQCHKPTDIRIDEVSHTYAIVSWSREESEDSWEVTIDSTTIVVSSPSYTITSLSSGTFYTKPIAIRSICAAGDTSNVRNATLNFVTECYDAAIPYVNDFESEVPGTTHPCWHFSKNVSIAANASYAHDGTNYLSLNGTNGGVYAISPRLSRPVKEVAVSFYEQEHGQYRYSWVYKNCIVGSITDPSDFSTFTPLDTLPSSQETYQRVERFMNDAPETDYYILFYYNGSNYAGVNSFCYIDSLVIAPLPTCLPVSDIRLDSVGITTAEISWIPGQQEQEWDVLVLSEGRDTLYNNIVDTNYCVLSSLTRDSLYTISAFIRATCQAGDTSRVTAATLTFTTKATCFPVTDIRLDTVFATSAELSWTPGKDEQAWDVTVLSTKGDTLFNNTVHESRCTVTGLTHRTPYSIVVLVRANCGDGDLSRVTQAMFSFETPIACGSPIVTMPFFENFESTSTEPRQMPSCWTKIVRPTGYDIYPYVHSSYTYCHSCDNTLYINGHHYGIYTILPEFSMDVNKLQISLWTLNSLVDPTHGSFIVGAMSNPNDSTTFFPIDTLPQSTDFKEHLVYLDQVPAGYKYIAILYDRFASGTSWLVPEGRIDDVTVDYCPACLAIEDIRMDSVGANNAAFSWTPKRPNPYGFEVTITNEYDGSVMLADTVYTPAVQISDLAFSSEYRLNVSVATICQPGNSAEPYAKTFFIKTECHAIDSLYDEGFEHFVAHPYKAESIFTPDCWNVINANGQGSAQRIYVTNNASFVHNGKQSLLFEYSYDKPSYAIMPEMNIDLSTQQISFYYHLIGSYHPGKLTLGYFPKDTIVDSAFVEITPLQYTSSWSSLKGYRLENVPEGARLAFKYYTSDLPNGCNATDAGIAIDDILIEDINNCHPPLKVRADSVTSHSVQVHWQPEFEDNTHFNVTILYGKDTLFHATEYPDTVCVIDNLLFAKNYYLDCYISTACSDRTSDPLKSYVSFVTECAPYAVPYEEDFESVPTTYVAGQFPYCWAHWGNRETGLRGWVNATGYRTHSGGGILDLFADSASWSMVALPEFEASIDTLSISFYSKTFIPNDGEIGTLEVGYLPNPADTSTFVSATSIPHYEQYTLSTVTFHNAPDSVHVIAFRYAGGDMTNEVYIDDITVVSAPKREEALEPVWNKEQPRTTKFIRNGQLFILQDGRVYTVFGTIVADRETDILDNL